MNTILDLGNDERHEISPGEASEWLDSCQQMHTLSSLQGTLGLPSEEASSSIQDFCPPDRSTGPMAAAHSFQEEGIKMK
jgi:hypothetical protein